MIRERRVADQHQRRHEPRTDLQLAGGVADLASLTEELLPLGDQVSQATSPPETFEAEDAGFDLSPAISGLPEEPHGVAHVARGRSELSFVAGKHQHAGGAEMGFCVEARLAQLGGQRSGALEARERFVVGGGQTSLIRREECDADALCPRHAVRECRECCGRRRSRRRQQSEVLPLARPLAERESQVEGAPRPRLDDLARGAHLAG